MSWRSRWETLCPLGVSITLRGWEAWSSERLLDELKLIRITGFQYIKIPFDLMMINADESAKVDWEYMDRCFDLAAAAKVKVIAQLAHRHQETSPENELAEVENEEKSISSDFVNQIFIERYRENPALLAWNPTLRSVKPPDEGQHSQISRLTDWLEREYGTVENLIRAWHRLLSLSCKPIDSIQAAAELAIKHGWMNSHASRRDFLRYRSHINLTSRTSLQKFYTELDRQHPVIIDVDTQTINSLENYRDWRPGATGITNSPLSLSPLPDELGYDFDLSIYIQSRYSVDLAREDSSFLAIQTAHAHNSIHSNYALTPNRMSRLLMLAIAAGNKGIAFPEWEPSDKSKKKETYALCDLLGGLTSAAEKAGRIAQCIEIYHAELWKSKSLPAVQILCSCDNEALAERKSSEKGSTGPLGISNEPLKARIGAARALMSQNIPFEFITDRQLDDEEIEFAPVLYLPWMEVISVNLIHALRRYAEGGGRVVAEMPAGYVNPQGERLDTRPHSHFERLFGGSIAAFHSDPTYFRVEHGLEIQGQSADLIATTAIVRRRFDDGQPAMLEQKVGKGSASIIAFPLSRMCTRPGNSRAELRFINSLRYQRGGMKETDWKCTGGIVFRRESEQADHYFILNPSGSESQSSLLFKKNYAHAVDVIMNNPVQIDMRSLKVNMPAGGVVWLRLSIGEQPEIKPVSSTLSNLASTLEALGEEEDDVDEDENEEESESENKVSSFADSLEESEDFNEEPGQNMEVELENKNVDWWNDAALEIVPQEKRSGS